MEIKPFRAYRFNPDVVGDPSDCIAPPYDVINPEQRQALSDRSPWNIVRITKGQPEPGDDASSNQYTRAAAYLNDWIVSAALAPDDKEAIYAYVQDYTVSGQPYQRHSFVAKARLEQFGPIVRPHEQTLSKPKADRLQLERATAAKFGLVFMIYRDDQRVADNIIKAAITDNALVDHTDDAGVRHRIFAIDGPEDVQAITSMMADKSCVIADGHHRYETALNYMAETGNPAAAHQMIAFANSCDEGLLVLATHRLVGNLENFDPASFITDLEAHFDVRILRFASALEKADARKQLMADLAAQFEKHNKAFGLYCGTCAFYLLVFKDPAAMDACAADMSQAWRALDVAVLHKLILEQMLGIDQSALAGELNVEYIKDTDGAIDNSIAAVDSGEKQIALFMNPPRIDDIRLVADAGEKMPQKSTYFYPKMYTGLLIDKL